MPGNTLNQFHNAASSWPCALIPYLTCKKPTPEWESLCSHVKERAHMEFLHLKKNKLFYTNITHQVPHLYHLIQPCAYTCLPQAADFGGNMELIFLFQLMDKMSWLQILPRTWEYIVADSLFYFFSCFITFGP